MEQIYHIGETAAAGILSVVSVGHPAVWSWFLIAASVSTCMTLREQSRRKIDIRSRSVAQPSAGTP